MYVVQRAQACDRAVKWTDEFQQTPRPPVLGKENRNVHDESNYRCRHDMVTQGGHNACSDRHRKCIGGTVSETPSSSQLSCVVSNDPQQYSDELLSTKRDLLTTTHDLCSGYQNRVNTACGESDFRKNLAQNRNRRVSISDTASRALCDVLVAETTSGLNDCRLRLCNENATASADLETVEQREVEGRSANGVAWCEESSETVSNSKAVFETGRQLLT